MLPEDLDLDSYDPNKVETSVQAGGLVTPGKYHARFDACKEVQANTGTTGTEMEFVILTGPFEGKSVRETLWNPSGKSEKGDESARNRGLLFAHRLGLIGVDTKTKKYKRIEGKASYFDCLGAEVVIEVQNEEYTKKDGTKGKSAKLTFGGLFDVADPKVKDVPKAKPGVKTEPKKPAASESPIKRKTVDVSEL